MCNGHSIQANDSVQYLGATIDRNLSFDLMAMSVIKKVNSRLKFLYRKRDFLTFHTKKLLVMAIAQCHFDYASNVWFHSVTSSLRSKLQVTQNKVIRFVLDLDTRAHIGKEQFDTLKWLQVGDRVDFKTLCHIFKVHSGLAPSYMKEHFVPASSVHHFKTRFNVKSSSANGHSDVTFSDSGRYRLDLEVKGFGAKSFASRACNLWNALPQRIRDCGTMAKFKVKTKEHLLSSVRF